MKENTIAAISTAVSHSGIGIVRISGDDSIKIADKVFKAASGKLMNQVESHTIHYGHIYDGNEVIDEVLVMIMRGPRSFTSEDTVEINCHGGILVVNKVLEIVLKNGAHPASAGEFTKRAFLNGRIDLSQAEAVIDVINAENEYALKSSLNQLKGNISEKIKEMRGQIIYQIAFIESALDDPEHISLDGYRDELRKVTDDMIQCIEDLIRSSDNGRMIAEGIKTVILGRPNAGKSSLLNCILGEERAIVTEIAGTTRDLLEEKIMLEGISLNMIDTAGIRDTQDVVEKIGVERALKNAQDADLILYVIDSSSPLEESDHQIIELIQNKHAIILLNKSDLVSVMEPHEVEVLTHKEVIRFSTKKCDGLDILSQKIKKLFYDGKIDFNHEVYITNARHKRALEETLESMKMVRKSIEDQMPEDFFSIDLMNAYEKLGLIIGESVEDDLIDEIFSKFCMGK